MCFCTDYPQMPAWLLRVKQSHHWSAGGGWNMVASFAGYRRQWHRVRWQSTWNAHKGEATIVLRTWGFLHRLARRRATKFIGRWMAALPPPDVGGGADCPPQPGRDGSTPISHREFLYLLGNSSGNYPNRNFTLEVSFQHLRSIKEILKFELIYQKKWICSLMKSLLTLSMYHSFIYILHRFSPFSVCYYLELRNAITSYLEVQFLLTKGQ